MKFTRRTYSIIGGLVAVAALLVVVIPSFVSSTPAPARELQPIQGRMLHMALSTPPTPIIISVKGCGGIYKGPIAVNQKLKVVNAGTVVRHQRVGGVGAIVPNLQPKLWATYQWDTAGVYTMSFTHNGCATPEKVIATVK